MGENLASKKSREIAQRQRLEVYEAGLADGIKQVSESERQRLKDAVVEAAKTWQSKMNVENEAHISIESCNAQAVFDEAVDALLQFEQEQEK